MIILMIMFMMKKLIIFILLLCIISTGCSTPRIFQAKVPQPITQTETIIAKEIEKSKETTANLKAVQAEVIPLNRTLEKHAGKKIANTGIAIPVFSLTGIIVIILLIAFPALIPVFIFIIRRLTGVLKYTISGIEQFGGNDMKNYLSKKMDKCDKAVISKLKQKL